VFVLVDLAAAPPSVTLEEPHDCKRFQVTVRRARDLDRLASALQANGAGRVEGEDAFIRVESIRSMAAGHVGEEWGTDFDSMLQYARSKGWLDETGDAIQAHVEWDADQGTKRSSAGPSPLERERE
jgi:hypothetical protein